MGFPLPLLEPPRPAQAPKPAWLKVRAPGGPNYIRLKGLMNEWNLHSVCEEAHCPHIGECWEDSTATFMILGDVCTRHCGYCAVAHGRPQWEDRGEPERIDLVIAAGPDVLNHNTETVPRLYKVARHGGRYDRVLDLFRHARAVAPGRLTKSGIILGLGETREELVATMRDLRAVDVNLLTLGQYLRPSPAHLPVMKYYRPEEFVELGVVGRELGFRHVESGPLVRSSYHAKKQAQA